MIETFYNIQATNIRKTTATPTGGDTVVTVSTFVGVLRPVDDVARLFVESNVGKELDLVADDSVDVKVGDDIYISGIKHDVLGVAVFEDLEDGTDSYTNIRVVKR
jgi:hypothetical protein